MTRVLGHHEPGALQTVIERKNVDNNFAVRSAAQIVACLLFVSDTFGPRPAVAEPPPPSAATSSEALVAEALKANRSISALKARIQALQLGVRKAGAWLDPSLAIEYSNMPIDAWRPGVHPMSGIQFKLSQTFYYPGKVAAREAVERQRVHETREALAEQRVVLRAVVRQAYYQLGLVRHLREVTQQHIKLVDQFLDVVKVKYEVGKAGQHELVRLQVLAKKLRDDLKAFARDDKALTSSINATLHRRLDVPIATPKRFVPLAPPSLTDMIRDAAAQRPALKKLVAAARTHEAAARLAAREGYPNITAWLGYRLRIANGPDSGTDFFSVGLSVPLPFSYGRRYGSGRDRQRELARSTRELRKTQLDEIRDQLARDRAVWQRAAQKAGTYRQTLMPLAHRALDATFAAYQVDRADFASLFQAELQLLDFERAIVRAEARTYLQHARAESLVGVRLTQTLTQSAPAPAKAAGSKGKP